eukprot:1159299-Pelagomonas_calceolata.AAC.3
MQPKVDTWTPPMAGIRMQHEVLHGCRPIQVTQLHNIWMQSMANTAARYAASGSSSNGWSMNMEHEQHGASQRVPSLASSCIMLRPGHTYHVTATQWAPRGKSLHMYHTTQIYPAHVTHAAAATSP